MLKLIKLLFIPNKDDFIFLGQILKYLFFIGLFVLVIMLSFGGFMFLAATFKWFVPIFLIVVVLSLIK